MKQESRKNHINDIAKARLLANINCLKGIISYIEVVVGKGIPSEVQKTFFEKGRDFIVSTIEVLGYKVVYVDDDAVDIIEEEGGSIQ